MNYLFCATCQTFGRVQGDTPPDTHAGHHGAIVAHDNSDADIARLFVGWLRIQRDYTQNPDWQAECQDFGCNDDDSPIP